MKVGDKDGTNDAIRALVQDNSGSARAKRLENPNSKGEKVDSQTQESGVDIKLGLGRAISQSLDPVAMLAERRSRVEELKRQVQGGTYKFPSSEELAGKLSDEIDMEISTVGRVGNSDTTE